MSYFSRFKFHVPRPDLYLSRSTIHDPRSTTRGITLIELLVVIAITVGYSKQSRNQILLTTEKAKIAQTIARAKSLTLAGYTKPVSLSPPCSYGFGIDYIKGEYYIFQYNPLNCQGISNLASLDIDPNQPNPPFKLVETFALTGGVNFKQENDNLSYLIFIPPNLTSLIFKDKDTLSPIQPLSIYLETPDQSLEKKIIVSPNGQLSL